MIWLQTAPDDKSTPLALLLALVGSANSTSRQSDSVRTPQAHRGLFPGPTGLPKIDNPRPSSASASTNRRPVDHINSDASMGANKPGKLSMAAQLAAHRERTTSATQLPPVPEPLLLRDVIYILQGIDGHWIKFSDAPAVDSSPTSPDGSPDDSFPTEVGITFTPSTTHSISAPTRVLLHNLAELGWLFRKISRAIEKGKDREDCGMVEQSLHVALGKGLTEYFRLIAILEGQLNDGDEGGEEAGGLTLRRLLVWTEDVRLRMRLMGVLVGETASKFSRFRSDSELTTFRRIESRWRSFDLATRLHVERGPLHQLLLRSTPQNSLRPLLRNSVVVDLRRRTSRSVQRVLRRAQRTVRRSRSRWSREG